MLKAVIIALAVLVGLIQSAFVVAEWEQAVVLEFGRAVRIIQEPGLWFKWPLIQELVMLDKKILGVDARPSEYITLDKKRLMVDTISRWRITDPLKFVQSVRNYSGANARLNDIIVNRLREQIANHNFIDFIREERERIMGQVTKSTREQAHGFGITVLDVRIKRVDLPEEVQASVFARMKAERERIAKRYRAEGDEQAREIRANAHKEREIILAEAYRQAETQRGQGDAEAAAVYAEAYGKDMELFTFLRHLETYKKVLGNETTVLLRPDSDLLRFLDTPGPSSGETAVAGRASAGK